ncbi:golgin subfamily A member 6-like protein 22 [Palaemon carinicauda]|uniref:golgin subfamily A member 6-like protein 22 n=1 Tax=Palaemon carinicauda TaxID=392227 RepID=UPI0035B5E311
MNKSNTNLNKGDTSDIVIHNDAGLQEQETLLVDPKEDGTFHEEDKNIEPLEKEKDALETKDELHNDAGLQEQETLLVDSKEDGAFHEEDKNIKPLEKEKDALETKDEQSREKERAYTTELEFLRKIVLYQEKFTLDLLELNKLLESRLDRLLSSARKAGTGNEKSGNQEEKDTKSSVIHEENSVQRSETVDSVDQAQTEEGETKSSPPRRNLTVNSVDQAQTEEGETKSSPPRRNLTVNSVDQAQTEEGETKSSPPRRNLTVNSVDQAQTEEGETKSSPPRRNLTVNSVDQAQTEEGETKSSSPRRNLTVNSVDQAQTEEGETKSSPPRRNLTVNSVDQAQTEEGETKSSPPRRNLTVNSVDQAQTEEGETKSSPPRRNLTVNSVDQAQTEEGETKSSPPRRNLTVNSVDQAQTEEGETKSSSPRRNLTVNSVDQAQTEEGETKSSSPRRNLTVNSVDQAQTEEGETKSSSPRRNLTVNSVDQAQTEEGETKSSPPRRNLTVDSVDQAQTEEGETKSSSPRRNLTVNSVDQAQTEEGETKSSSPRRNLTVNSVDQAQTEEGETKSSSPRRNLTDLRENESNEDDEDPDLMEDEPCSEPREGLRNGRLYWSDSLVCNCILKVRKKKRDFLEALLKAKQIRNRQEKAEKESDLEDISTTHENQEKFCKEYYSLLQKRDEKRMKDSPGLWDRFQIRRYEEKMGKLLEKYSLDIIAPRLNKKGKMVMCSDEELLEHSKKWKRDGEGMENGQSEKTEITTPLTETCDTRDKLEKDKGLNKIEETNVYEVEDPENDGERNQSTPLKTELGGKRKKSKWTNLKEKLHLGKIGNKRGNSGNKEETVESNEDDEHSNLMEDEPKEGLRAGKIYWDDSLVCNCILKVRKKKRDFLEAIIKGKKIRNRQEKAEKVSEMEDISTTHKKQEKFCKEYYSLLQKRDEKRMQESPGVWDRCQIRRYEDKMGKLLEKYSTVIIASRLNKNGETIMCSDEELLEHSKKWKRDGEEMENRQSEKTEIATPLTETCDTREKTGNDDDLNSDEGKKEKEALFIQRYGKLEEKMNKIDTLESKWPVFRPFTNYRRNKCDKKMDKLVHENLALFKQ